MPGGYRMTGHRRIALVTHGFEHGGGVPSICRWLRAELAARGDYTVDVHDLATSRKDRSSRGLARPASWGRRSLQDRPDRPFPHQHWGANLVEIEAMRYRPRRELTEAMRGYDLIQVVSGSPAWAGAVLGCRPPVVIQAATLVTWERPSQLAAFRPPVRLWRRAMTGITASVDATALRGAAAVLVENQAMFDHVRRLGQERVRKAPPGTDTLRFSPAGERRRRGGYLLSVCRLADPRKGLDLMVRAYRRLVDLDPAVPPLVLAGQGTISPDVARAITGLGLSGRVEVRPDVPPADLPALYRGASLFLQTSYEEGLGLSVVEAMSSGLPVVATATHGTRETVVDGATGWLVDLDHGDLPGELAQRLRLGLTGQGDRAGRLGRARAVAEFSTDACLGRFLDVYDAVLSGGRDRLPGPSGRFPTETRSR